MCQSHCAHLSIALPATTKSPLRAWIGVIVAEWKLLRKPPRSSRTVVELAAAVGRAASTVAAGEGKAQRRWRPRARRAAPAAAVARRRAVIVVTAAAAALTQQHRCSTELLLEPRLSAARSAARSAAPADVYLTPVSDLGHRLLQRRLQRTLASTPRAIADGDAAPATDVHVRAAEWGGQSRGQHTAAHNTVAYHINAARGCKRW